MGKQKEYEHGQEIFDELSTKLYKDLIHGKVKPSSKEYKKRTKIVNDTPKK